MSFKFKGKRYKLSTKGEQKLIGLALIAISIIVILMTCNGTTIEDRDGTAVLLFAPLGLYLLFGKKQIIE